MSLLEKAKEIVKEKTRKQGDIKKRVSPWDEIMNDPEVKKTARYLAKHLSLTEARKQLNALLEKEGRLPKMKNGKVRTLTYLKFKEFLPEKKKS